MKSHEKFLEFNAKNIIFININGSYWIALKPICEALGIDFSSQLQKLKNDEILGSVVVMNTTTGSDGKNFEVRSLLMSNDTYIL